MMGTENSSFTPPLPPTQSAEPLPLGTEVIYGLHGKCQVMAVEPKTLGGNVILFYRLEPVKSTLSRSQKKEPAIWIPVDTAHAKGLRSPTRTDDVALILETLGNEEQPFDLSEQWNAVHPKLEATIRAEGAIGLAKVAGFLWILKRRQFVLPTEIQRYLDNVFRVLYRELSDALGEPLRAIEERVEKLLARKEAVEN